MCVCVYLYVQFAKPPPISVVDRLLGVTTKLTTPHHLDEDPVFQTPAFEAEIRFVTSHFVISTGTEAGSL